MSVESEILRARKRPMGPDKMFLLLVKLRKGATSTLSFGKLLQVLECLDWKVAPVLGWTPRHYTYQGKELMPVADTIRFTREGLDAHRADLKLMERSALPEYPRSVREVAIMDVGDVVKGAAHRDTHVYYFHWREWVATEGLRLTSPRGVVEEFFPDHHDLDRGRRTLADGDSSTVHDVWNWLMKEGGVEDDVNLALGTEKHVPAAERTRENTGTCPACWGNFKLLNDNLVMHGYQRPGYGFIQGSCFCVGMPPLETSKDGAVSYRNFLKDRLGEKKEHLERLVSGDVESVEAYGRRFVKKGEPSFERSLERAVDGVKYEVEQLITEVELQGKVLGAWVERPMPKEGEPRRGPVFFLSR